MPLLVVHFYPDPARRDVSAAWRDAVTDARLRIDEVALIWRDGRPRPTGQEAASWRTDTEIDPEFDDDDEFVAALDWANSVAIRRLRRVMVWVDRTPEGLAGLLRHELEHTIQLATEPELEHLHGRAREEIQRRSGSGKSYNAIPMEIDANRAAARFLRSRFGADRLGALVRANDLDSACFRPTAEPESLDTLRERMLEFVGRAMREHDFIARIESAPPAQ